MDNFIKARDLLIKNFEEKSKDVNHVFQVLLDKDEMWNLYLDSFPDNTNNIYRVRREYDCSCCRGFIKNIGNLVFVSGNKLNTIWDFDAGSDEFNTVFSILNEYVLNIAKQQGVEDVFLSKESKIGCHHNFEKLEEVGAKQWDHFFLELPSKYVINSGRSKGDILGDFRDTRNVFKRSLDEITLDAVDMILDLIEQNILYRGNEWKTQLEEFRKLKKDYINLDDFEKGLFAWSQSVKVGAVIGRIRNHSIGTLLVNVSEGMELDTAVKKYEQIVAPSNYKRSNPIFSQKQLEDAQNKLTELGYMDSLARRFATLDDITVNDILFNNKDTAKRIKGAEDVFAELSKSAKGGNSKKFTNIEEVTSKEFIDNILPNATNLELYLENKHTFNMVSLIAPQNTESKSMFKWGNNYSWVYSGNITDSDIKENVKSAGGNVSGDLRFSIQWNDVNTGCDNSDLDAHCITPKSTEIFFGHKVDTLTGGNLDVDITHPENNVAVENIVFPSRNSMTDGVYKFFVKQYQLRKNNSNGFRAEIEFDGQIYSFDYPHEIPTGKSVEVAQVTLKNGKFTIKESISSSMSCKDIWNVKTNDFVPVSVVCYSPNYWETAENNSGHKHLFFMLNDCINDERPSGLFNEFLVHELNENRKVMEALASKMRVEDANDQLSGVGFAMDKRAEVVVKVNNDRTIKIKF